MPGFNWNFGFMMPCSVDRQMVSVIQPILEKGIVDHSIIHRVLMEYFSIADKSGRRVLLQLHHPNCSRYLSPDDLASLNLSIPPLCAKDESELNSETKSSKKEESSDEKTDQEAATVQADESENLDEDLHLVEGGKKDPYLRRQELLVNSGLAESLIDECTENAGELLRSNFGKEVIYEVASGGSDDILRPSLNDKLNTLHEAIASLAAESKPEASEEEHILENFHSSRTIRKLFTDCPTFASTLWKKALKGKCKLWAQGHSSKVVSAFVESLDSKVRELAKKELQPLIDGGILKLPEAKHPQMKVRWKRIFSKKAIYGASMQHKASEFQSSLG